uniref:Uncharacterized protein n=1 Tax=Panagrolaimus sp. ES5 TaxID=591445 RepID=A0AC34FYC8_9BILA
MAREMTGEVATVNSPNQHQKLPLDKQAELLFSKKLTSRQLNHFSKVTGKSFTYKNLMKKLKPILDKFPVTETADGKQTISLITSLKERLKNLLHKLPKNKRIRVTIVADKGEKITKICYFFNDVKKPQATENLAVLCFYIGDDDSESIKSICESLNQEIMKLINDGIIIDKVRYDFEFFITGDCKSICAMIGVQGGSAMKFCQHCLTSDYCINGESRTMSGISSDARAIVHETANVQLQEIICGLKVEPIQGRAEYNGNGCRKIVKYFNDNAPQSESEIPMFHFFKAAAKIQSFSVAKNLTKSESDECADAINRLFDDLDGLRNFKYNNKLHILRFHVIPFIVIHGSWGLFSEQGIERLHCLVNEYRKRVSTKNGHKKNIYAIKMLILGTFFHDFK